jgi:hypothetical protein
MIISGNTRESVEKYSERKEISLRFPPYYERAPNVY